VENARIYFNRKCLSKRLTPSYAKIKIPNTSPAHRHTQQKVTKLRIKDEIKFLHCKKQKLNSEIYQTGKPLEKPVATHTTGHCR
jgi:hypothetical protein